VTAGGAGGPRQVGLVVTCYERTVRDVLAPGFFPRIVEDNERPLAEVVALINNVDDPRAARRAADALVDRGEITSYAFVADRLDAAVRQAALPRRALRVRPYLLDYGLVMPHLVSTPWLLGWDAETRLVRPANWIDPALTLLEGEPRLFHASLSWPRLTADDPGLAGEEVARLGRWSLNWGFSDQLFLVRSADLRRPVYQHWTAAAYARHAPHPYTFEYRVESYQRWSGRMRATLSDVAYTTHTIPGGVLGRTGGTSIDHLRIRLLHGIENAFLNRLPAAVGPRWTKRGTPPGVRGDLSRRT
jgi:hypothetical protein